MRSQSGKIKDNEKASRCDVPVPDELCFVQDDAAPLHPREWASIQAPICNQYERNDVGSVPVLLKPLQMFILLDVGVFDRKLKIKCLVRCDDDLDQFHQKKLHECEY